MSFRRAVSFAAAVAAVTSLTAPAFGEAYLPITPTAERETVTLTGRDLSIEDIVKVARFGASVQLSPAAKQQEMDNYGLLLEASAEGIPVYWFNRGAGDQRETVMFEGDPLTPQNRAIIERTQAARFKGGALYGTGPEVAEEEIVRAMMVVRANAMVHNAPSPALSQMLLDFINKRITPVVQSRGTLGEGDLAQLGNVGGAMVGGGDVYLKGVRMPAADALKKSGLTALKPFAADDNALTSSNAYAVGQAALLVHDARAALEWTDLTYAIDLNGMNSSITPLSLVVQHDRPDPWLNWDAARVLEMLKGSYLFENDAHRIIQDPESLRASSIRQGAAWEAWNALSQAVLFQANTSDHNPAVNVGLGPDDSWELATPQMMRFYVKGGTHSNGKHGYIVSNANWDPYPLSNILESFTIALANMDIAVMLRIERFRNPFFTGAALTEILPREVRTFNDYAPVDLQQEIASLIVPLTPFGSAIVGTVEDLQANTRIKVQHARAAVDTTFHLLGFDLMEGTLWLDARKKQDAARQFGPAPTAAWTAFRKVMPMIRPENAQHSMASISVDFVRNTPAARFTSTTPAMPTAGAH